MTRTYQLSPSWPLACAAARVCPIPEPPEPRWPGNLAGVSRPAGRSRAVHGADHRGQDPHRHRRCGDVPPQQPKARRIDRGGLIYAPARVERRGWPPGHAGRRRRPGRRRSIEEGPRLAGQAGAQRHLRPRHSPNVWEYALRKAPYDPRFRNLLKADFNWLVAALGDREGWRYTMESRDWDNSCTQYGVLGFWAAARAGFEPGDKFWLTMSKHFRSCQTSDGGWGYQGNAGATPNMATAGWPACSWSSTCTTPATPFGQIVPTPSRRARRPTCLLRSIGA